MITCGDDVRTEIEELFCDGGREAEAAGGVFAIDDEQINVVGFKHVGKVFAHDMTAGGSKDIADKEDIHWKSLHGCGSVSCAACPDLARLKSFGGCLTRHGFRGSFLAWHRVGGFN